MRRRLTAVLAIVLLLGLGALAVLALPNTNVTLVLVSAAAPEFNPDAVNAAKYNLVAMPLNASQQFTSHSPPLSYNADGLAALIGRPGTSQVLRWNATTQLFEARAPDLDDGPNFDLQLGGVYYILVDRTVGTVVSFVGNVPDAASFTGMYNLVGGVPCKYNAIMAPLNRSDIVNADGLATAIGSVEQVLQWDPSSQLYVARVPSLDDGPNFDVRIGYPYFVCMTRSKVWP